MSRARPIVPPLLAGVAAILAAAAFAACGGDSGSSGEQSGQQTSVAEQSGAAEGSAATAPDATTPETADPTADEQPVLSDAEQVSAAIEALLADPDSETVCQRFVTENLLAVAFGSRRGCVAARQPETLADDVELLGEVRVDGDRATVRVVPSGGLYDGEKLDVTAVREGDRWRIDELEARIPVGP